MEEHKSRFPDISETKVIEKELLSTVTKTLETNALSNDVFLKYRGKNMKNFLKKLLSRKKQKNIQFSEAGKSLLVLLLGRQTTPNIDSINFYFKERKPVIDNADIVFVSTDAMEKEKIGKSILLSVEDNIENFTKRCSYCTAIVDETDFCDIKKKLSEKVEGRGYANIFVNLTGGNKMMALAVYDYFRSELFEKVWINMFYYNLSDSGNSKKVVPVYSSYSFKARELIASSRSLKSFFQSCGIKSSGLQNTCLVSEEELIRHLPIHTDEKNKAIRKKIREISQSINTYNIDQNHKEKITGIDFDKMVFVCSGKKSSYPHAVLDADLKMNEKDMNKVKRYMENFGFYNIVDYKELFYAADGWFEELTYYVIRKKYGLSEGQIGINVKIFKNISNELDVVFVNMENNSLCIVECKNSASRNILRDAVYKLSSIGQKFGMDTQFMIWTTAEDEAIDNSLKKRAEEASIEIVEGNNIAILIKEQYGIDVKF